jgi:hypothetical protein
MESTCKLTVFRMTNANTISGASLYVYNHTDQHRQIFHLATSVCCVSISRAEAKRVLRKNTQDNNIVVTREVYMS